MRTEHLTKSPSQTKELAKELAKKLLKSKPKNQALVLALEGELGGGKTTFLQGFAKSLGIKQRILSPTFVILKKFQVPGNRFQYFYHLDCYRIEKPKEILDLNFKEIISDPQNIVAIEWADKIKKILPKETMFLEFKSVDKNKRKISIIGG